ncbi:MAG: endonuclease III [Myxococcales bacterium]
MAARKKAAKAAPEKAAKQAPKKTEKAAPARASKSASKKPAHAGKASPQAASFEDVRERLEQAVPDAVCELEHKNPFELLIATILSAQSTDRTVNSVTPVLFKRWPTPKALAEAGQEEVEEVVKRTGFFRNKAKSIRGAAAKIMSDHGGKVPKTIEELVELPGVARKTANVVLGTGYGIASGFVVDTHVTRVAGRLGLTEHTDPVKIEADLCQGFPEAHWVDMSHRVLLHGRYTCLAKRPYCRECPLNELCPAREDAAQGTWKERAAGEASRLTHALKATAG